MGPLLGYVLGVLFVVSCQVCRYQDLNMEVSKKQAPPVQMPSSRPIIPRAPGRPLPIHGNSHILEHCCLHILLPSPAQRGSEKQCGPNGWRVSSEDANIQDGQICNMGPGQHSGHCTWRPRLFTIYLISQPIKQR